MALIFAGVYFFGRGYSFDIYDTGKAFRENVAAAGYENTINAAYPMTDVYAIIEEHFKAELSEGKTEKKAIVIGYDGCRADILNEREDNGGISYLLDNGGSNNLLYCGGVNYPKINTQDTSTAPGWCSIMTGVWADTHGIYENGVTKDLETKTLMTSFVEDGIIDNAAFITIWSGHFQNENSTYKAEKDYCEENGIDVDFELCKTDSDSHLQAMNEITGEDCADFLFVIYECTDSAGHGSGFSYNNPEYKSAFLKEDAYAYDVIKAIESRETYGTEDWLIIITSDHGGFGTGHGGASVQERMTFVVMNKKWDKS